MTVFKAKRLKETYILMREDEWLYLCCLFSRRGSSRGGGGEEHDTIGPLYFFKVLATAKSKVVNFVTRVFLCFIIYTD